jgi:glucose-1-phosphate thymidylyltransferase
MDVSFTYKLQKQAAKILIKEVIDPNRYGVVELNEEKIISIEEKPRSPKSSFAVTGISCMTAPFLTL